MSGDERLRRQRNLAEHHVRALLADTPDDVTVYGAGLDRTGHRTGMVGVSVFARSLDARTVIEERLRDTANLSPEEWANSWVAFGRSGSDLIRVYPKPGF